MNRASFSAVVVRSMLFLATLLAVGMLIAAVVGLGRQALIAIGVTTRLEGALVVGAFAGLVTSLVVAIRRYRISREV